MSVILKSMFAIAIAATAAPLMWASIARGDPGDVVITRQVSPRTAFRAGTGPVSSKVNAAQQVKSGLGLNQSAGGTVGRELSDGEFANVVSGIPQHGGITAGRPDMSGVRTSGMASYGVSAGTTVAGLLAGGGGGGGGAGAVTRQATGQIVDALKGAGLIGR